MKSMSEFLAKLETFPDLEVSIIRATKINKVLKAILKLEAIPKEEEFQFKPARRVHIPKSNGSTRPLAIASPKDKIVQEAMRMILEAIFEPSFSDLSHGVRPNRSCHSAMKSISQ